jgi:hypothetical protein
VAGGLPRGRRRWWWAGSGAWVAVQMPGRRAARGHRPASVGSGAESGWLVGTWWATGSGERRQCVGRRQRKFLKPKFYSVRMEREGHGNKRLVRIFLIRRLHWYIVD